MISPGVGNGPLNVVLDCERFKPLGAALPAGARFAVADQVLRVGEVAVDLSRAVRWDARPDWPRLRARWERRWERRWVKPPADKVENLLKQVPSATDECASAHFGHIKHRFQSVASPAIEAAIAAFGHAWRGGSTADLQFAVCNLLGLGPGLTPAGDDWLAGWLLGQHLGGDLRELALSLPKGLRDLEGLIAEVAAERTTTLSRAFLECAAAGEADEAWHELLDALAEESANQQISKSANQRISKSTNQRINESARQRRGLCATAQPPARPCSPASSLLSKCLLSLKTDN